MFTISAPYIQVNNVLTYLGSKEVFLNFCLCTLRHFEVGFWSVLSDMWSPARVVGFLLRTDRLREGQPLVEGMGRGGKGLLLVEGMECSGEGQLLIERVGGGG